MSWSSTHIFFIQCKIWIFSRRRHFRIKRSLSILAITWRYHINIGLHQPDPTFSGLASASSTHPSATRHISLVKPACHHIYSVLKFRIKFSINFLSLMSSMFVAASFNWGECRIIWRSVSGVHLVSDTTAIFCMLKRQLVFKLLSSEAKEVSVLSCGKC